MSFLLKAVNHFLNYCSHIIFFINLLVNVIKLGMWYNVGIY